MRVHAWQFIVIVLVIVLLFGAPKLPELARSLGKSLRILKDETKALTEDDTPDSDQDKKGQGASEA